MFFSIKWSKKKTQLQQLVFVRHSQVETTACKQENNQQHEKKDALSLPVLNFLLFFFILSGFVS